MSDLLVLAQGLPRRTVEPGEQLIVDGQPVRALYVLIDGDLRIEKAEERLVDRDASDGTVGDLGAFHNLWFEDPDGMQVELTVIVDAKLHAFHEPRPLANAPS